LVNYVALYLVEAHCLLIL